MFLPDPLSDDEINRYQIIKFITIIFIILQSIVLITIRSPEWVQTSIAGLITVIIIAVGIIGLIKNRRDLKVYSFLMAFVMLIIIVFVINEFHEYLLMSSIIILIIYSLSNYFKSKNQFLNDQS